MGKEDIWHLRKLPPMPGKIHGAETNAQRAPDHKLTIMVTRKVAT